MTRQRIDHVGLNVLDLDESIAFYRDMFGFRLLERWDNPRQAFVGADDSVLGLMEAPDYDYRAYTKAHLAFSCNGHEFPQIVAKVHRLCLEVLSGPKPQRAGETILFRDPSGNILEICYPSIGNWLASRNNP